jgi:hypothetical protein
MPESTCPGQKRRRRGGVAICSGGISETLYINEQNEPQPGVGEMFNLSLEEIM